MVNLGTFMKLLWRGSKCSLKPDLVWHRSVCVLWTVIEMQLVFHGSAYKLHEKGNTNRGPTFNGIEQCVEWRCGA